MLVTQTIGLNNNIYNYKQGNYEIKITVRVVIILYRYCCHRVKHIVINT